MDKQHLETELEYASTMAESYKQDYDKWRQEAELILQTMQEIQKQQAKDKTATPADIGHTSTRIEHDADKGGCRKITKWQYEHFWYAHTDKIVMQALIGNYVTATDIREQIEGLGMGVVLMGVAQDPVIKRVSKRLQELTELGILKFMRKGWYKKAKEYRGGELAAAKDRKKQLAAAERKAKRQAKKSKESQPSLQ